jgi:hypothetical protein
MCPTGFEALDAFAIIPPSECLSTDAAVIRFCQTTAVSPESDWGGAYLQDDASCNSNPTCYTKNPLVGTPGACACPDGFDPIKLRVRVPRCGGVFNSTLAICFNSNAKLATFGGAYEDRLDPEGGPPLCEVKNPITKDCTCPIGTSDHPQKVRMPTGPTTDEDARIVLCHTD